MSAKILRLIGILLILGAIVSSILNLKRVADAGTFWLTPLLLIIGLGLGVLASRQKK